MSIDMIRLTLQDTCEYRRHFVDHFTSPTRKIHNSRIYKLPFGSRSIPFLRSMGKYQLPGDAACQLRETLVTPSRDYRTLTCQQKSFDTVLGSTGVLIQNAFGLLITLELLTVHRMSRFIAACCVLHNLRIDAGDTEVRDTQVEELMLRPDSRGSPEEDLSLSDATARVLRRIKWDKLIFNEKRAM